MIIEISVGAIALAFVALSIFLIKVLITMNATLKQSRLSLIHLQKEVGELSQESQKLLHTLSELSSDIKHKSAALNFLFHPMAAMTKESHHKAKNTESLQHTLTDVAEWLTSSILLYKTLMNKR